MTNYRIPRFIIAGTNSGCGKTTVTCAIMKAFANRGLHIAPFKCGPDYIDTMFHTRILDTSSANLDSFFFTENTLRWLLAKNSAGKDISIIEGVMGYYDGLGINSAKASTYDIARLTKTPVILVLNAKGSAYSLLAEIHGFLTFFPENQIHGIILNHCSPMTYRIITESIQNHFTGKVKSFGYMPDMPECSLESRHLGLVTAQEVKDLSEKTNRLAYQAEKSIDLNQILLLAQQSETLSCEPASIPNFSDNIRIAVAKDNAFCFYYHDNLDMLSEMGAEIISFSPLKDTHLPENIHGLYLGGGYPELYAEKLSGNSSIMNELKQLLINQIPCIAECGGFMYLTAAIDDFPMVGYCSGKCCNTKKLTRFGYVKLKANCDNLLCKKGEEIAAHEFHYWDCNEPGEGFTAQKISGKQWNCVHANEHLFVGFPHIHFYSNPKFAENFYKACLMYKEKHNA